VFVSGNEIPETFHQPVNFDYLTVSVKRIKDFLLTARFTLW